MKSFHPMKRRNAGLSVVEVVVGIVILAITALMIARTHYSISKAEDTTKKKSLAGQVCMQLMDEMRHLGTEGTGINTIDDMDDGATLNPNLFVVGYGGSVSPAHQMLLRQINVFHVPGEDRSRRVRVRVFDKRTNDVLAETIGFIRIYAEDAPSVQSFTTFNLPSTFGNYSNVSSFLNPSLSESPLYVGWRMSRDPTYHPKWVGNKGWSPYNGNFTDAPTDRAYLTTVGDYVDMYNNLERYPPEEAEYLGQLLDYEANGPKLIQGGTTLSSGWGGPYYEGKPVPPLRFLLNEMAAGNPRYRHALLQNNGIMLTLPPMRNYSDAAKDPENKPYVRAVVHPEHIHYEANKDVKFRVYTYVTQPDNALFAGNPTTKVTIRLSPKITNGITIKRMIGNANIDYQWKNAEDPADYSTTLTSTETVITLLDSPLRHPARNYQGISPQERLYGMEYIPCLVSDGNGWEFKDGREDLSDNDGPDIDNHILANNTARWVITIDKNSAPTGLWTAVTYLGDEAAPHTPPNRSTTYVWVNTDLPLTEKFQLLGDPRHMPYADVKKDGGYNKYFRKVEKADGYTDFDGTQDGWEYIHGFPNPGIPVTQRLNFDFPRYMEIYRTALLNSNSSFLIGDSSDLNLNATPFAFVTLGRGFIGLDNVAWNGPPLRCPETAWVPNSTDLRTVIEIAPGTTPLNADHTNLRLIAKTDNSWFCLPWLGELYPDDRYNFWKANGNLPTGPGNFYRAPYSAFFSKFGYDTPKDFAFQAVGAGLATLVNGGETNNTFAYNPFSSQQAATYVVPLWKQIEQIFLNFQGRNQDMTSSRFRLNEDNFPTPIPGIGGNQNTKVALVQNFMTPSAPGNFPDVAGILRMWDPNNNNRSAWVVLNGNDAQSTNYDFLKYAMNRVMLIWSFLEMGSPNLPDPIRAQPVPRIVLTSPDSHALIENPASISLAWATDWHRWDGKPYTADYSDPFTPTNATMTYSLLYSADNRNTWIDIDSGRPTTTGVQPWSKNFSSPYAWNVQNLPAGRYVIRVEAFRGENSQHFAYHERRIEITRP